MARFVSSIALLTLVLGTAACGIGDFDVDQEVPEQQVQGSQIPTILQGFFQVPLEIDLQSKIAARDTGPVDTVFLAGLTLSITPTLEPAGDDDDWAFLDHLELFVESTRDGSGLPKVKVGEASSPGPVPSFDVEPVAGVNLQPYVAEGVRMTATATGHAPEDDVAFDGVAVFRVSVL